MHRISEVQLQQLLSIQEQRDELKQQLEMQEKTMREAVIEHNKRDKVASMCPSTAMTDKCTWPCSCIGH